MAEQINLTTPAVATNTFYKITSITFDLKERQVVVQLVGTNDEPLSKTYNQNTTPTGASLLSAVNTSNNTSTSLIKRVYNQLVASGVIVGTVSGTPD